MDATKGAMLVDANGFSYWSPSGKPQGGAGGSAGASEAQGQPRVEQYTGTLNRDDEIPHKPVAAMSYGGRVRIARIYQNYEEFIGQVIKVSGWAKTTRASSKEFCFVELNDGSHFKNLQCVINHTVGANFEDVHKAIAGASLTFSGTLIKSPAKGQDFELAVNDASIHTCKVLGHSDGTYPIAGRPKMEVSNKKMRV